MEERQVEKVYRSSVAICTPALPTTGIILTNMGKTARSLELQLAAISTYTAEGDRVVFKCIRDIRTEVQSNSTETCSALEQLIHDLRIIKKRHDAMQYRVALLESQKKHLQEFKKADNKKQVFSNESFGAFL